MNYKVFDGDNRRWETWHKGNDGHYEVVRPGLPCIQGINSCDEWPTYRYDQPHYYETIAKKVNPRKPWYYFRDNLDYLYTAVETKTTKVRKDVFDNGRRLITRKYRPVSTYRTDLYF
jgi:hypothetical protein